MQIRIRAHCGFVSYIWGLVGSRTCLKASSTFSQYMQRIYGLAMQKAKTRTVLTFIVL